MLCRCCIRHIETFLKQNNYIIESIDLGKISVGKPHFNEKELNHLLLENGYGIIKDRKHQLIEQR